MYFALVVGKMPSWYLTLIQSIFQAMRSGSIKSISFLTPSPPPPQFDGVHVVSGSLDTSIRVWDVETGNCLHTLIGHQSLTSGLELKNNILVSGNADSTVKVWDITTGQCLQTLQGKKSVCSSTLCLMISYDFKGKKFTTVKV